jgi:MoxR-like ATPase
MIAQNSKTQNQASSLIFTIQQIEQELNAQFLERSDQIRGALVALLSRQHLLLFGPPGTAKSLLVNALAERVLSSQAFIWLLTKFTTPDELFGPISMKGLEQDQFRRITAGKLPEAHLVFLDECFKASSAILNALLTLTNERLFYNNGQAITTPLLSLFAASNELPEGEELAALHDRFALRYFTGYLTDSGFEQLLSGISGSATKTTLTLSELEMLQQQTAQVTISKSMIQAIVKLRVELRNQGIVASDRRWKQSLTLLQAHALLEGRTVCEEEDLQIYTSVLWSTPDQIKLITQQVNKFANPLVGQALEIQDRIQSAFEQAMASQSNDQISDTDKSRLIIEANTKVKSGLKELQGLVTQAQSAGRSTAKLEAVRIKISSWNKQLVSLLKLDI